MTQPVRMYRSNSGSLYDNRFESLRDDLKHLFMQSDTLNEASATKLVEWLTHSHETTAQLSRMTRLLTPRPPHDSLRSPYERR